MILRQAQARINPAEAGPPPLGRPYDVGGRRLWLHGSGVGGPAVGSCWGPAPWAWTTRC